jgi:hypothetical protein
MIFYDFLWGAWISGGGGVRRGVEKHEKKGHFSSIYRKVDLAIAEPKEW